MLDTDPGAGVLWYRRNGVVFAILAVVAALAYYPALTNGFYNDDALFLNHARRVLADPAALLSERPLGYFRPVWSLWIVSCHAAFGLAPLGFYACGIAVHAVTAILLYRIALRVLGDGFAALATAIVFTACYAHNEAMLWIAAQNSSLVCCLAFAALLAHLRACETDSLAGAIVTAVIVVLMLLTKEPGIVATAWLPLAEWRVHGFRRCFTKRALARYAIVAAAGVTYLAINSRLLEDAFAGSADQGARELRSTLGFVSVERVLGTAPWVWSAQRLTAEHLAPWLGAAMFAVPLGLAAWLARKRVGDVLLAFAIYAVAATPACSTNNVQFNGSRLYYFPTAGSTLLVGALIAIVRDRAREARAKNTIDLAIFSGLALFAGNHISQIHTRNRIDYKPISQSQTRIALDLRNQLAGTSANTVFLVEPWIDNEMHAKEFFALFTGVPERNVSRMAIPRREAEAWFERQQSRADVLVLDCDSAGGLFRATKVPPKRNSSQGTSRDAEHRGEDFPILRVLAVRKVLP
jgi:hypothetical protein